MAQLSPRVLELASINFHGNQANSFFGRQGPDMVLEIISVLIREINGIEQNIDIKFLYGIDEPARPIVSGQTNKSRQAIRLGFHQSGVTSSERCNILVD